MDPCGTLFLLVKIQKTKSCKLDLVDNTKILKKLIITKLITAMRSKFFYNFSLKKTEPSVERQAIK